jgi:hypothetical protein
MIYTYHPQYRKGAAILPPVPDELTSTAGIVALIAGGLAVIALLLVAVLAVKLRRLRAAQKTVLGDRSEQDLVGHAQSLQATFSELSAKVEDTFERLGRQLSNAEQRLEGCISHAAVVRYDAYNEMSGRQSSSLALLDDTGSGVVMSSILHREQARTYVKGVRDGNSELELSPEEREAIQNALGRDGR